MCSIKQGLSCSQTCICVCYLAQRFEVCLHDEVIFAQLAAACIGTLDPLVQAGLVHKTQTSCTVAGGDEWTLFITFTVTDPAQAKTDQPLAPSTSLLHPSPFHFNLSIQKYLTSMIVFTYCQSVIHRTSNGNKKKYIQQ